MFAKKGFTAAAILMIAMFVESVASAAVHKPGLLAPMPITPIEINWIWDVVIIILMGI